MTKEKVLKRLIYKQASFLQGSASLQDRLDQAMIKCSNALDREYSSTNYDCSFLLNTYRANFDSTGNSCGVIVRFSRGHQQPVVGLNKNCKELPIEQFQPPKLANAAATEFLDRLGFFAVRGNHVLILQAITVPDQAILEYMNWLLIKKSHVLPQGDLLELSNISSSQYTNHRMKGVSSIKVGTGLDAKEWDQVMVGQKTMATPKGEKWDAFKAAFESMGMDVSDVQLDPREAEAIEVELTIKVNKKNFSRNSVMLDQIGNVVTGLYGEDTELQLENGTKIKGADIRISKMASVNLVGSLPEPDSVFREMSGYFQELRKDASLRIK